MVRSLTYVDVSSADPSEVTQILDDIRSGRANAASDLLPKVYQQLRAIAQQHMNQERASHTLEATALVHEAYLRLVGSQSLGWDSRAHFFTSAAEAMRRILIEHARGRKRIKRGGERQRVPLTGVDLAAEHDEEEILAVDEAFRRLETEDPSAANVVRLRFYAGLSVAETAAALGISQRSVAREWAFARAWLHDHLSDDGIDSQHGDG
jgi:RNA polymerase sigma factor (TIGR02999 family)